MSADGGALTDSVSVCVFVCVRVSELASAKD